MVHKYNNEDNLQSSVLGFLYDSYLKLLWCIKGYYQLFETKQLCAKNDYY